MVLPWCPFETVLKNALNLRVLAWYAEFGVSFTTVDGRNPCRTRMIPLTNNGFPWFQSGGNWISVHPQVSPSCFRGLSEYWSCFHRWDAWVWEYGKFGTFKKWKYDPFSILRRTNTAPGGYYTCKISGSGDCMYRSWIVDDMIRLYVYMYMYMIICV